MEIKQMFLQISEKEYRDAGDCVSYSFLKILADKGPRAITDPQPKIEGDGVVLGTIVDKLLTEKNYVPESEYEVLDIDLDLSGTTHISKILKFLKDNTEIILEPNDTSLLERIYLMLDIKRAPKLDDNFWEQVKIIYKINSGCKFISPSELQLAKDMANAFTTHKYTMPLFDKASSNALGIEIINQAKYMFNYNGVNVKIMLDLLRVDHVNKIIIPFDIKTGSDYFYKQFANYKYQYQGGLYHYGLSHFVANYLPDYKVAPFFEFIYIGRNSGLIPVRYRMNIDYIEKAQKGFTTISGYKAKGILELIDDYKWYVENNVYDRPREVEENNGVIELNCPL